MIVDLENPHYAVKCTLVGSWPLTVHCRNADQVYALETFSTLGGAAQTRESPAIEQIIRRVYSATYEVTAKTGLTPSEATVVMDERKALMLITVDTEQGTCGRLTFQGIIDLSAPLGWARKQVVRPPT